MNACVPSASGIRESPRGPSSVRMGRRAAARRNASSSAVPMAPTSTRYWITTLCAYAVWPPSLNGE